MDCDKFYRLQAYPVFVRDCPCTFFALLPKLLMVGGSVLLDDI